MNEAEIFFQLLPVKDRETILNGIADDIKRDGNIEKFYDFFVGLIIEDIETYSKYEPRLLSLCPESIANILLKWFKNKFIFTKHLCLQWSQVYHY